MKKDGRSHTHETLEQFRMLAIDRIRQGESPAEVSRSFGMHRSWGYRVAKQAAGRGRGKRALKSTPCTGRPRKLTPEQEREIFRCMDGKHPHQYGFDFALWSRAIVAAFILERFEVTLSLASVGAMLKRLGLSVQKPLQRAYQRNPQAIKQWTEQTFPDVATAAKEQGADIYFWDESGFRADSVYGKTWAVKGQTPVVQVPGQRQKVSAASAVNSKGGFWFATYQGAMTGEVFVDLLKAMMHKRKKSVHLVVDGLPAHKRLIVKEYVQSTKGKLTMHFLPGYAPDLNPDELVWSYAKAQTGKRGPMKQGEKLQDRVDEELSRIKQNPALVRQFFKHPDVAYISNL
jgi:transposase